MGRLHSALLLTILSPLYGTEKKFFLIKELDRIALYYYAISPWPGLFKSEAYVHVFPPDKNPEDPVIPIRYDGRFSPHYVALSVLRTHCRDKKPLDIAVTSTTHIRIEIADKEKLSSLLNKAEFDFKENPILLDEEQSFLLTEMSIPHLANFPFPSSPPCQLNKEASLFISLY